jgi:hypothetical protein
MFYITIVILMLYTLIQSLTGILRDNPKRKREREEQHARREKQKKQRPTRETFAIAAVNSKATCYQLLPTNYYEP